jgi:hypothetical protein
MLVLKAPPQDGLVGSAPTLAGAAPRRDHRQAAHTRRLDPLSLGNSTLPQSMTYRRTLLTSQFNPKLNFR